MLLATRKKPVIKISEITFDLEIINPIESKNLFGGCDYRWDCGCPSDSLWNPNPSWDPFGGPGMIGFSAGSGHGGDSGGGYEDIKYDINYDQNYDQNYDSNYDGISDADDLDNNGINDADQKLVESYPGENLSDAEKSWLYSHLIYVPAMINNKNIAETYGQGQHNGVYDALRHALWSALDHHDIGALNAYNFHTLHETANWHPVESPSDLINNGWGYNWSMANGNAENNINQFIIDFNAAVANGQISIIP